MEKTIRRIHQALRGPNAQNYRKIIERNYESKGQPQTREIQFLRPKLYCYAVPEHFTTMPPSQPTSKNVHVYVTNAGGRTSYNTIVKLISTGVNNNVSTSKQTLTLQSGETKTLTFSMNTFTPVRHYQIVCFDPLHDPISSTLISSTLLPSASPSSGISVLPSIFSNFRNYLTNSADPIDNLPQTAWHAYSNINGRMMPTPIMRNWKSQRSNPSPAIAKLTSPGNSYWATRTAMMTNHTELRQVIVLEELDFSRQFNRFLSNGDLLASLDAYVRLEEYPNRVRASIRMDFLDSNEGLLKSFETQNPSAPDNWYRHTATISIPAATAKIVFNLICKKRSGVNPGNAYFDELYLSITHRNVFSSGRI